MSRSRHTLNALQAPKRSNSINNVAAINEFSDNGIFNHAEEGRFTGSYYFLIDKIAPFMEVNGFETLNLIGSNITADFTNETWEYWREQDTEEINKVMSLITKKAADSYLLGLSNHLL